MESIAEDSTGILLESLLEGYAEFYSAELSEKAIRGRTENALKCKWNGGTLPIGLKVDEDKRYAIDPLTAPLVLEAFEMYAARNTITHIASALNEKGVHSRHNAMMTVTA
jgi:DNA invertase Pin-like site-specific DNA recombinase